MYCIRTRTCAYRKWLLHIFQTTAGLVCETCDTKLNVLEYLKLCCGHFPAEPSEWSESQRQCVNGAFAALRRIFEKSHCESNNCGRHVWMCKSEDGPQMTLYDLFEQVPLEIKQFNWFTAQNIWLIALDIWLIAQNIWFTAQDFDVSLKTSD